MTDKRLNISIVISLVIVVLSVVGIIYADHQIEEMKEQFDVSGSMEVYYFKDIDRQKCYLVYQSASINLSDRKVIAIDNIACSKEGK